MGFTISWDLWDNHWGGRRGFLWGLMLHGGGVAHSLGLLLGGGWGILLCGGTTAEPTAEHGGKTGSGRCVGDSAVYVTNRAFGGSRDWRLLLRPSALGDRADVRDRVVKRL